MNQMNPPAEQGAAVETHAGGSASGNLGWTLLPALLPIDAHQASEDGQYCISNTVILFTYMIMRSY